MLCDVDGVHELLEDDEDDDDIAVGRGEHGDAVVDVPVHRDAAATAAAAADAALRLDDDDDDDEDDGYCADTEAE